MCITVVAVYVDDLILMSSDSDQMQKLKQSLADRFKMKDMGPLHYLLGITVVQDSDRISTSLSFSKDLVLIPVSTPVSTPNVRLAKSDGVSKEEVDQTLYQSLVGSLLYAAIADISQAVGAVSKFCSKLISTQLPKRYDRSKSYLHQVTEHLEGYADADWAGDLDTRRSTTGNLFTMNGGAVSWTSKAQSVVALSSSEAEY